MRARRSFGMSAIGRRRSLVAAVLAGTLAVTALPATAADPLSGITSVIGTPIESADDETTRFVELWDSRFRSGPVFQAYLDSTDEYDDGYNGLPEEEQIRLVRALVRYWHDTDDAFREQVDFEPRSPDDDRPYGERAHVDQIVSLVNAMVFHKEEFKKSLRDPAGAEPGDGNAAPQAPEGGTPADPLGEQAATELAEVVRRAREMAALDGLAEIGDAALAPDPSQVREIVPPDVLDRIPSTGVVAGVDLGEVGELLDQALPPLPRVETPAVDTTPPAAYRATALDAADLLYGVCWAVGSGSETCTAKVYPVGIVAQVPGQAAMINVDNNMLTGTLGFDLEIRLMTDPTGLTGGASSFGAMSASASVRLHGTAARYAKGVIRYGVPGTDKDVLVGFDGRTAGLQTNQSAAVLLENVLALSSGDVRVKATVSHDGAPGTSTVNLVTDLVSTVSTDRFAATTSFVRAPAAHTVRLRLAASGQTSTVRVESSHNGVTLPDIAVAAAVRQGSREVVGTVRMTGVPTTTTVESVNDEPSRATTVTYTASSQLNRLQAAVRVVPNVGSPSTELSAALDVRRLPTSATMVFNDTQAKYDANAGISAASGSDALQASFEQLQNGNVRRRAFLGLSSAPTSVLVSRAPSAPTVVLDSGSGIARISAMYFDQSLSLNGWLTVEGFPGHAELRMPSSADPKLAWTASAATTKVATEVKFGAWVGAATITNVPASISVVPRTNELDVNASAGAPATITARISNTGTWVESPHAGDNWATLTMRRTFTPFSGSGSWQNIQLNAALHVTGIQRIRVTPGAPTTFELRAGGGAPLYVLAKVEDFVVRRYAEARLVNFPGVVTGSIGATTEIWSNANTDLTAYVESGPLGTHQVLAAPHGIRFWRTATQYGTLNRAAIRLTGLPTYAKFGPGVIALNGLKPADPTLTVDVKLLENAAAPVEASAWLSGIPVGTPHDVSFTWSTQPNATGPGYTTTAKATTSGATFGALSVRASYAQYSAYLDTSALPKSMKATITETEGQTRFEWDASAPIASLEAGMLARPTASSSFSGRGSVTLTTIPSWFSLTVGRGATGTGPVMAYDSNNTGSLNATVVADGSLRATNATYGANLFFKLTSLAKKVDVTPLGAGFRLSGTGRTTKVEAKVNARASLSNSGGDTLKLVGEWVRMPWEYKIDVAAFVKDLSISLNNVATFEAVPGLVTRISGDYGDFGFSYASFSVRVEYRGKLSVSFSFVGTWTFEVVKLSGTVFASINPSVRVYAEGWQNLFDKQFSVPCLKFGARADVRPRMIGQTDLVSGVGITGVPGAWRNNWVTPVLPSAPWISDVATGLSLYGTSFVSGSAWATKCF